MGNLIQRISESDAVELAAAASALDFPPAAFATVPAWWSGDLGCVPRFELEVWAEAALTLTAAELFGAMPHATTFADLTISAVDATANTVTSVGHGRLTGDGPVRHTTAGTVVTGLATGTDYWLIKVDADKVKFATSLANALAGVAVDITGAGTGTRKVVATADTERLYWHTHGLLGPAGDGEIDLDVQRAYLARFEHSPRTVAYAITATFGDAVTCSASIYPYQER